ncbi:MAG: cytochrome c3 family protein [Armatimonadota bacterium]|nr:cytochrome c3 family protein [Armatimonadota bacterium]
MTHTSYLMPHTWVRRPTLVLFLVVLTIAVVAAARLRSLQPGPEQPIPFSHRVHAGDKEIGCFFCHQFAMNSSNAGMPSVEKCLLCHNVIAMRFPPIAKIHTYYSRDEGIPWKRVNRVPDFVHFSHEPHLARGFDCGRCHGNVREMDRVSQANVFTMDFCIKCHRQNKASQSCFVCHY